ncbi:MAG: L,D-transpeptidase family protein [Rhodoblastus sp.]|nr:L,D-transpeptidase family protein [Rhodoblastus sp.]
MQRSKHEYVRLKPVGILRVVRTVATASDGRALCFLDTGFWRFRCSLGRSGVTRAKREGDGCTPIGRFEMLEWRLRSEGKVVRRPLGRRRVIRPLDGWCDDPRSGSYNTQIGLPSRLSHENMWRADNKYDVIAILNYNISAKTLGRGSAIFFHLCSNEFEPTAGCVAVPSASMSKLIPLLRQRSRIDILSERRKLPNRPVSRSRRV